MNLLHPFTCVLDLPLDPQGALEFVRDVPTSLREADFINGLAYQAGPPASVAATIPVNASLFGQRDLPFQSLLLETPDGAALEPLPVEPGGPAWAEVAGTVRVAPVAIGARVSYALEIAIHLDLPKAERWGGRALERMIGYTAERVLESLTASFPAAIESAAGRYALERVDV